MRKQRLPVFWYDGETAAEIIALKESHDISSLLFAFEEGIQNKEKQRGTTTKEEQTVLAVMALQREVNNGGHWQFFYNSSRRFASIIEECLLRIQCHETGAIVADAIAALGLTTLTAEAVRAAIEAEDPVRDRILKECDERFYKLNEIEASLLAFIEANQDRIHPVKSLTPPLRPEPLVFPNLPGLHTGLLFSKTPECTLDGALRLTRVIAQKKGIEASETEIEGAAAGYALECSLKAGDLAACEPAARRSFELVREDATQSVLYRKWIYQLITASRNEQADAVTLEYLEYLSGCDRSKRSIQNRIKFWAAPLQEHRAVLPNSVKFFVANFPEVDLDKPLPKLQFVKGKPSGSSSHQNGS